EADVFMDHSSTTTMSGAIGRNDGLPTSPCTKLPRVVRKRASASARSRSSLAATISTRAMGPPRPSTTNPAHSAEAGTGRARPAIAGSEAQSAQRALGTDRLGAGPSTWEVAASMPLREAGHPAAAPEQARERRWAFLVRKSPKIERVGAGPPSWTQLPPTP